MKKLVAILAFACASTFANAAAVGWSCAGATAYAGNAYSFFVIGNAGVTSTTQISDLILAGADVSSYALGSGTVAANGAMTKAFSSSNATLDPGTYDAFFVLFDSTTQADANNFLVLAPASTQGKTITAQAASFTFAGQNQSTYINTASNWTAVPEPTSGLLLLLGMAGLALKRKVA